MQKHILSGAWVSLLTHKKNSWAEGRKSGKQPSDKVRIVTTLPLSFARQSRFDERRRNGKLRIMNILVKTSIPCNCLVFVAGTAAVAVFTALRGILYSPPLLTLSLSLGSASMRSFWQKKLWTKRLLQNSKRWVTTSRKNYGHDDEEGAHIAKHSTSSNIYWVTLNFHQNHKWAHTTTACLSFTILHNMRANALTPWPHYRTVH